MDKYIGRLLDNRYEILEVLGTGGMAVVYKARCHRLNRFVAIKILKDDYLEDEEFRRRFHSESQAVAMLSHPNIVSVYDVSTSIMADYIVMELIDGITLKQYMEKKGVLNWKETLHFAIQIAKALEHAHSRGIVHRDIKPHNIMVLKNGSVKVTDFGIARMMSKGNTLTKEALGSVHYISPEQAKGGRVDNRSDIYSLGVVMYEMMSGRPPYDGESPVSVAIQHINGGAVMPSTLNPNIPGGLEQIIMHAMAREPAERYNTATQMLADMDEFRKNPGILFDYNTPPLDEVIRINKPPLVLNPEQPVSTAQKIERKSTEVSDTPRKRTSSSGRSTEQPAARRRSSQKEEESGSNVATIAIIACSAVMVIAIVIFLVVLFSGGTGPSANMVDVPLLIGEEYASLPKYPDFSVKIEKEIYDDQYPAGQIIDQKPSVNEKIEAGKTIYVTLSKGPAPKKMQNLANWELSQAERALNNLRLNLVINVEEEYNDSVQNGYIIRTAPMAETELVSGQEVTLYVSLGSEITNSFMPDVTTESVDGAKLILDRQTLNLQIVEEYIYHASIPAGQIISTAPAAGESLTTGQTVTIYISKGPNKVAIPPVLNMLKSEAVDYLNYRGFKNLDIQTKESTNAKDTVIELRVNGKVVNSGDLVDTSATITVVIATPPTTVTKDVVISIGDAAQTDECLVVVTRDGVEVFRETVPMGTTSITIKNQTGTGTVLYVVDCEGPDSEQHLEVFS
ncbi:MAG: Stk1 family PASTA domain-containing Ser/Thr kinase [Oscillospiraceae bacterium]|nr:Stk1 family PASTA domain-containing Ser/Thr kinase [Oscillospiraceae bacterium]